MSSAIPSAFLRDFIQPIANRNFLDNLFEESFDHVFENFFGNYFKNAFYNFYEVYFDYFFKITLLMIQGIPLPSAIPM